MKSCYGNQRAFVHYQCVDILELPLICGILFEILTMPHVAESDLMQCITHGSCPLAQNIGGFACGCSIKNSGEGPFILTLWGPVMVCLFFILHALFNIRGSEIYNTCIIILHKYINP